MKFFFLVLKGFSVIWEVIRCVTLVPIITLGILQDELSIEYFN